MPIDTCRLCQTESELRESHVIPAFVYRWLRESSGGGHLRSGLGPNKRVQDGFKFHWLCQDCETLLSRSETLFANRVFYPYLKSPLTRIRYSRWMIHFCASVSWRVLTYFLEENKFDDWEPNQLEAIYEAEKIWRSLLLGEIKHPSQFQQHMLPLDKIESTSKKLPSNINRYLTRAIEMDLCRNNETIFTFSKLGRFIILGFVREQKFGRWKGAKIHANEGTIEPKKYELPQVFGDYLNERAIRNAEILDGISKKQKGKVRESFIKNAENYVGSDAFGAMQADISMFGKDAFAKEDDS